MDFTREPIIETVITPREGYRLVVRSSKSAGIEEHFVDALEVVSFGNATFFRSKERPKPFIVPIADYEVLEVREARMVLKTPIEGAIKIAAGEKAQSRKAAAAAVAAEAERAETVPSKDEGETKVAADARADRRRDRRRALRRRRGQPREEVVQTQEPTGEVVAPMEAQMDEEGRILTTAPMLSQILPPPATLIRDDLERLRKHEAYKGAFYEPEDEGKVEEDFPPESFGFSDTDINMKEGGDVEVPQEDPFRLSFDNDVAHEDASKAEKNNEV